MQEYYLKKIYETLQKNNFYTGAGAVLALVALVVALVALYQ